MGWQRRLAILPRRLAAALRRRLGRDQEVGDVGHPRAAVAEEDLPDGCLGFSVLADGVQCVRSTDRRVYRSAWCLSVCAW